MKFIFLPHTADIKFQSYGKTLKQTFENASYALTNIITKDKISKKIKKRIKVKGKDKESLLYNFLEEFLILFDSKGFILSKVNNLKITRKSENKLELIADIAGDYINKKTNKYEIIRDIKAITYNDMFIKKDRRKFICQVVVDV